MAETGYKHRHLGSERVLKHRGHTNTQMYIRAVHTQFPPYSQPASLSHRLGKAKVYVHPMKLFFCSNYVAVSLISSAHS